MLWEKFEDAICENYDFPKFSSNITQAKGLANINSVLQSMGKSIMDYAFTNADIEIDEQISYSKEIQEELSVSVSEHDLLVVHTLNEKQKYAYNNILQRVLS